MFTRMPCVPASIATTRASCAWAALAAEYAAKSLPGAIVFFVVM